ncbi:hypothetical protein D3C75_548610 [compost metagenome]
MIAMVSSSLTLRGAKAWSISMIANHWSYRLSTPVHESMPTPHLTSSRVSDGALPTSYLHWCKVGKDAGNVRNHGPSLIDPISLASDFYD